MKKKAIFAAALAICLAAVVTVEEVRIGRLKAANADLTLRVEALEAQLNPVKPDFNSTEIAAEFNGGVVTVGEAAKAYAEIAAYYELAGVSEADYAETAKRDVLANLVEDKILRLKAAEYGVDVLTAEEQAEVEARVQAKFDENVEYYMAFRNAEGKTDEEVRQETIAYLEQNGYTYASLLEEATADLWYDRLYAAVTADVQLDDAGIRALYESEVETAKLRYAADFSEYEFDVQFGETILYQPAGVRNVQAILIGFTPEQAQRYVQLQDALENGDATKLAEIEALYQELAPRAQELLNRLAQGEDFVSLMDEYSDDAELAAEPARSQGIPVSAQSTIYEDAFVNGAMALAGIGDSSDMIYVDAGIYILRYASDLPEGPVAFEEVRDQLAGSGVEAIRMDAFNRTVEGWLEAANIRYYTDRF